MEKSRLIKGLGFTFLIVLFSGNLWAEDLPPLSADTETCIECHASLHPGIVEEWQKSSHARTTPGQARKKEGLERLVSAENIPESLSGVAVGCAECHTMDPEAHKDSFEHADFQVHTVVTPGDCAICHPVEVREYGDNLMSQAYGNLQKNPVFRSLMDSINGFQVFEEMEITHAPPNAQTEADSCLFCHGTEIQVKGTRTLETDLGEMSFPELSGWPNQGVGRVNPDNTRGSCSACHSRHRFSLEMARKPYTCSECHKGPDVPAYGVYSVSKHGNIFRSHEKEWDFKVVPWTLARDFTAPTCAACHISLLVSGEGDVLAKRTHRMNDRLPWRLLGLIYAHAHPRSPDTSIIRNRADLPLPTELTGEPVEKYLIDRDEQEERQESMEGVCLSCHSSGWVDGHFKRLENTLKTTNEMTLSSTKILISAWDQGVARGLAQKDGIFNEAIEKKWVEQWLFYANSTRFASAMAGADYGVFANGRWHMSKNIREMIDYLRFLISINK